jgi:polar amino acid transport system substrate-binding protein
MGAAALVAIAAFSAEAAAQSCQPKLPAGALVSAGKLTMSMNPTIPPLQFINDKGELQGMRVELGAEIAKRLCLTPEWVRVEFSAMIPGLQGGRWDVINTGIFFTEERAKLMKMIPYENQAISISVPNGNPQGIKDVKDLSGRSVGVELGGYEERQLRKISEDLVKAGGKAIDIRTFNNFGECFQALRAGQLQGVVAIDASAKFYQDRGDFTRAMFGLNGSPAALAMKNDDLAKAVGQALTEMKADGSYDALLTRYGLVPFDQKVFEVKGPAS